MPFDLILFLAITFAAALVAGLAGFAFGLIAAAIWLHILSPVQVTILIAAYALLIQGYSTWKLRHAVRISRLWPFLAGGAVGVPIGGELLRWASAGDIRSAVGMFMVLFCLYSLARPKWAVPSWSGRAADGGIGIAGGIVGGATGLGGILPTLWCAARGWPKDEQRAVFQPVAVGMFVMTLLWLGGRAAVDTDTARLFLIGLPAVIAGTWFGLKWYARLGESAFRRVVLGLLLVSGLALAF
ncbi:MAG: sulfite exporter TauE/SafE family protein [Alphaproteobacteria bacterium]|nr:sulfite exporter TauE/SafE family protein [Alphaproteobacteria bacterium]